MPYSIGYRERANIGRDIVKGLIVYSFKSTVRYSECDAATKLTIPALMNYLQDCSTFHTESIGHGVAWCAEHHFAWFVAAWHIVIEDLPRFTQDIEVRTWSRLLRPTMASRGFTITDAAGTCMVRADSLWFPFDTVKQRPVRIPQTETVYLDDEPPADLPIVKRKLRLQGEGTTQAPIVVLDHHLDTNRHVNNGQYVAMADGVLRAQDKTFDARSILVQYKQAAKLGDVIVPYLYVTDDGYAVDLAREDGMSYAIVRMVRR